MRLPKINLTNNLIKIVRKSESKTFSDLCEEVGLIPSQDLRGADLSFVNFSESDLRGYDFRGAYLFGAIFSNAIIDNTTKFDRTFAADSIDENIDERKGPHSIARLLDIDPDGNEQVKILFLNGKKVQGVFLREDVFSIVLVILTDDDQSTINEEIYYKHSISMITRYETDFIDNISLEINTFDDNDNGDDDYEYEYHRDLIGE